MAVPAWILQSPLTAGIGTMEAGGRLGLAARDTDLREAAQLDAAREAEDRMGLSMQEMQQRREQAAAHLAQSLRAQTALEQYRQSEIANQQALRQQAQNTSAAMALHQAQQQKNWQADFGIKTAAEKRLEDAATSADSFESGNAEPLLDDQGNPTGYFKQRTSRGREQLIKPVVPGDKSLTPNQAGAQLMNRGRIIQFQLKNLTGEDQDTIDQKTLLNQELGFIKSKLGHLTSPKAPLAVAPAPTNRLRWNPDTNDFE